MDTEKILSKFTPKDYHNELEMILEKKDFSEDAKNLLLSCIYKIEDGYRDYEIVKQSVVSKKEYLEEILTIVKQKCKAIEIKKEQVEELSEEIKTRYEIDRLEGTITIWHPNEKTLLYALYELDDKQVYVDEKYSLIRTPLSELLNKGENMNRLEVLRDFNGWNWNTDPKELQNISINLVYQNLIDLLGINFMEEWVRNSKVKDYFKLAKEKIAKEYGKKNEEELFYWISKVALISCTQVNAKEKEYLLEEKQDLEKELTRLNNKRELLEEITNNRKEGRAKIKEIDTILNDKELLAQEFIKRNEQLSKYHRIYDLSHLTDLLKKQRKKIMLKMEEENKILEPAYYVEAKTKIEEKLDLLNGIELEQEEVRKKMIAYSIELERKIMDCFKIKLQKIDQKEKAIKKEELIKAIYQFRYYCYLYIDKTRCIGMVQELEDSRREIKEILLQKAEELKYVNKIAKEEQNLEVFSILFSTRIINLENIIIELKQEENIIIVIYDGDVLEKAIPLFIPKEDLNVKLDKRVKLLG